MSQLTEEQNLNADDNAGSPVATEITPMIEEQQLPIILQPTASSSASSIDRWMGIPTNIAVCPSGLEYLETVDQLVIRQKVDLLKLIIGIDMTKKFTIRNAVGQAVFTATEKSDCCERYCLGSLRSFELKMCDNLGNEVLNFYQPSTCCVLCSSDYSMEVSMPHGSLLGTIEGDYGSFSPTFFIKNHFCELMLRIESDWFICSDAHRTFKIINMKEEEIGVISGERECSFSDMLANGNLCTVTFPLDLNVRMKALLLGAAFVFQLKYFGR